MRKLVVGACVEDVGAVYIRSSRESLPRMSTRRTRRLRSAGPTWAWD